MSEIAKSFHSSADFSPQAKGVDIVEFRNFYTEVQVGITFTEPTKTQQQFEEECNINSIVKRYRETGVITHLAHENPLYGDFSEVLNYQDALSIVIDVEAKFEALPASLRKRFDNDPAQMLEFLQDESNYEEAVELGLLAKRVDKAPETVEVSSDTGSGSVSSDIVTGNQCVFGRVAQSPIPIIYLI